MTEKDPVKGKSGSIGAQIPKAEREALAKHFDSVARSNAAKRGPDAIQVQLQTGRVFRILCQSYNVEKRRDTCQRNSTITKPWKPFSPGKQYHHMAVQIEKSRQYCSRLKVHCNNSKQGF